MSYRFMIVNTDYPAFMEQMYLDKPKLWSASFSEQYAVRIETLFGVNDFYSSNLRKLGHEAIDSFYNNRFMQYAWAVENRLMPNSNFSEKQIASLPDEWLASVLQAQIKMFKPDVFVNLAMDGIGSSILASLKSDVPLIIGQHAAPINPAMNDLSAYDLIVSSLPHYVTHFRQQGKNSEHFKLGFESTILDTIQPRHDRNIDVAFVGGFSGIHTIGRDIFNHLAEMGFSMALYGYEPQDLSPKAMHFFNGEVNGLDMYKVYAQAKIVINKHVFSVANDYANNMRLYESTGMGSLLITDHKKNLDQIFKLDSEVIAYQNPEQCAELVKYYLDHEDERKQIALNGQKRILSEHTYSHRMTELVNMIDHYLQKGGMALSKNAVILPNSLDSEKTKNHGDCLEDKKEKLLRRDINKKGWNDYAKNWDNNKATSNIPGLAAEDHGQARYLGDEWNIMCEKDRHPYGIEAYSNEEFQDYLEAKLLKPYLPIKNDLNIMELGPGGGRLTQLLVPRCQNLYAVDICQEMLKQLQKKFADDARVKYVLTDGNNISGIPSNSLDCIVTFDACVHMEPYEIFRYLELSKDLLKEGGIGIIHFSDVETEIGFQLFRDDYKSLLKNGPTFSNFSIMSKSIMSRFLEGLGFETTVITNEIFPRDAVAVFTKKKASLNNDSRLVEDFPEDRHPSVKTADTAAVSKCTRMDVSSDSIEVGLQKIRQLADKNRFGSWEVHFNGLTIFCHDLLSFYMAAKDIFLHRIYDFKANTNTPIVIDGGGHIGLFTLYIKQKYPNAKITVFEPDTESLEFLRKNLQTNSITDVTIVEAGLHKENGVLSFTCDHSDGSAICDSDGNTSINVVKLSDYIGSDVDFMKLNIEGAELDVITEMTPKLEKVKELVIEYHGFPEIGQNLHKILAVLDKTGFRYSIHDFDAETNPATKPPFKISKDSRFFLLIYAKKLFLQTASDTLTSDHFEYNTSHLPVSRQFGFDRGTPIDRYYIENFLKVNASAIRGRVLEIADNAYTVKFGSGVTQSDVLNAVPSPNATIVGDLTTGQNIPESSFDCIIMTQTIQMIYDVKSALKNAVKALKPGGTLLLTASGISQISRYDMDRWGEYWRFTDKSLKMMLSEFVPETAVNVESHGNVTIAKAFLDGLAYEELDAETLNYNDNDYQVLLTAAVCKPAKQLPYNTTNTVRQSANEIFQQNPLILLYHRVADDPIDSQLLAVSPNNFEAHLRELAENYRVVSLRQLLAEARTGQIAPNTIAITFDDGYIDNLTNALPLLEKYGLHATIFVTSGMVGSDKEFWWDALERLFLVTPDLPQRLNVSYADGHFDLNLTTPQDRVKALDELAGFLRLQPVEDIEPFVDKLFEWAQISRITRDSHRVVNSEQLRQLASSPSIEIGSHTVTHTRLSSLSPDAQLREIRHSKQYLESVIGKPVRMLSYPFGSADDFTAETVRITTEEGFEAGIANIQGSVNLPIDMYSVPRRLVRNWTLEQFAAWLKDSGKSNLEAQTIARRVEKLTESTAVFVM